MRNKNYASQNFWLPIRMNTDSNQMYLYYNVLCVLYSICRIVKAQFSQNNNKMINDSSSKLPIK